MLKVFSKSTKYINKNQKKKAVRSPVETDSGFDNPCSSTIYPNPRKQVFSEHLSEFLLVWDGRTREAMHIAMSVLEKAREILVKRKITDQRKELASTRVSKRIKIKMIKPGKASLRRWTKIRGEKQRGPRPASKKLYFVQHFIFPSTQWKQKYICLQEIEELY